MVTITDRHQKGKYLIKQALKILAIINQVDLPIIYKDIGEYLHCPSWETFRYYLKPRSKRHFNPYELSYIANQLIFSFSKFIIRWCEETANNYGYNFSCLSSNVMEFITSLDVSKFPITFSSHNLSQSTNLILNNTEFIRDKVDIIESKISKIEYPIDNQVIQSLINNKLDVYNETSESDIILQKLEYAIDNDLPTDELCQAVGNLRIERSIPLLSRIINNPKCDNHFYSLDALARIGGESATQVLLGSMYSWLIGPNSIYYDKESILFTLSRIGTPRALECIIDIVINPKMEAFFKSPRSLIIFFDNVKNNSAIPFLINALQSNDSEIRYYCTVALGNIHADIAIPHIINLLSDKEPYVHYIVSRTLKNDYKVIQDPCAVQALINSLYNKEARFRKVGLIGLSNISPQLISIEIIRLIRNLIEQDPNGDVVKEAVNTLSVIDHNETFPHLWNLCMDHKFIINPSDNTIDRKETLLESLCDIRFLDDLINNLPQTKSLLDKLSKKHDFHLTPDRLICMPNGSKLTVDGARKEILALSKE